MPLTLGVPAQLCAATELWVRQELGTQVCHVWVKERQLEDRWNPSGARQTWESEGDTSERQGKGNTCRH